MIVAVVGISFAAFTYTQAGERENTISTGTVTMTYTESTNGISIENAIPMDDEQGKKLSGDGEKFDFNVSATIVGKTTINYVVVAKKDDANSTISDDKIRLYLEQSDTQADGYQQVSAPKAFKADESPKYGAEQGTMELATGSFISNGNEDGGNTTHTKYYRLRMWVDKSYVLTGESQKYKVTVNVYGKGKD